MDQTERLIEAGTRPRAQETGARAHEAGTRPRGQEAASLPRTQAGTPPRAHVAPATNGRAADPLRRMRTRDLVTELARKASLLAKKEIELAKVELKADVRSEIKMASGLGVAGLCAIFTLQLLLTALVLGLMEAGVLPGWGAALLVAAVVLVIGAAVGLWGWAKRVRKPLDVSRRSLKEDVRWAKERMA